MELEAASKDAIAATSLTRAVSKHRCCKRRVRLLFARLLRLQVINDLAMHKFLPAIVGVATLITLSTPAVTMAGATPDAPEVRVAQQPNCNNPQTQSEMNACAGISYQNAYKRLNQVYQQLLLKLSASRRQKLTAAQQAWINFRNASCAFERSEVEGGTMAPMIYSGCMATLTEQRTKQLQEYLKADK